MEDWRTRSRDTGAVEEGQTGFSSPCKRLKMSERGPPPDAFSKPGPRTMRSSSSCPTAPTRSRPSTCARPRKRGPIPPSPATHTALPPSTKTPPWKPDVPVDSTESWSLSWRTASCLSMPSTRTMSRGPPERTPSHPPLYINESSNKLPKEPSTECPRILLPPGNPSTRLFWVSSASSSSSHQDCLDSEERKR